VRLRLLWIAPAILLTRCLFPSLDGLSSDASVVESGVEASADVANDVSSADASADVGAADGDAALGTYVEEVLADSPASWWRLGESSTSSPAADEMKVQNGTYRTGVTLGLGGAIGKDTNTAASFDGTSGAMYLPGTMFDFGGSPPFAIEVWVSPGPPTDSSDPLRRIVSHRTTSPYFGWFMAVDNLQRVVFTRWDSNATVASVTSTPLAPGWSHVVVSADGTTLTLYVDGASVATGAEASITDTVATHLSFGSTSDFTVEWYDGALDEPAIYAHPLAPARVLAHYLAGIAK
jgi:hypothetical protein